MQSDIVNVGSASVSAVSADFLQTSKTTSNVLKNTFHDISKHTSDTTCHIHQKYLPNSSKRFPKSLPKERKMLPCNLLGTLWAQGLNTGLIFIDLGGTLGTLGPTRGTQSQNINKK